MKAPVFLLALIISIPLYAQQVADTSFHPILNQPEYQKGKGPVVFIDEGHYNFHTKEGRYKPFATLLESDGYVVNEYKGKFSRKNLSKGKILVISNALNEWNESRWFVPVLSAFTEEEITTVKDWVNNGGSLFLIADHMPMSGAAKDLTGEFGFEFTNGFVIHDSTKGTAYFNFENKGLSENIITNGRSKDEKINHVVSFTGQGFKIPADAVSILTFDEHYTNLLPDTAWVFKAPENYKLLLNIIHWLDGKL